MAVAYMLAILDDPNAVHPPLECVFTVQEEVGLAGAENLDPSVLDARTLINLDGSPFGTAVVSCAGGLRAVLTKNYQAICTSLGISSAYCSARSGGWSLRDRYS
ncbi:MAG: hypothetical protein ACOX1Q_05605 [Eubacteriales bacterium]